ncbi:hypothetical protein PV327_011026 [Microctonus hyperodae]|uniref:CCHC-type domain-containing protein n=1 Tax=Microctonus hyperodae TaxID=165561 RepID=A0AA39FR49_MICHY|nr:hypothetical protein PV327_011026 [Microctonus hyperodae]
MANVMSNTRLELLPKDNYDTWTMQVEALLTRCELWEYVIETIVKSELVAGTIKSRDELFTAEVLKVKTVEENEACKYASGEVTVDVWNAVKSTNKTKWSKTNNTNNNSTYNNIHKNNNKSKKIKCYRCGKAGHIASNCFTRKSSGNQQSNQPTANNVDETYALSHTVERGGKLSGVNLEWILDSGATAHLCGDLNLLNL